MMQPLHAAIPPWVVMWTTAVCIYAACKGLTLWMAVRHSEPVDRWRALGYLVAWPGMNASAFLFGDGYRLPRPSSREWLAASLKTLLGVAMVRLAADRATSLPLLSGWLAMAGIVFILHFGTFHLIALAWRRAGFDAQPVMRNPLRAASLGDFWSRRWNTAFHELAVRFTFRPLRWLAGPRIASVLVFLISGLIHELVISVPARAGYGLPNGYFLVQGLGVAMERTPTGRRIGLGYGVGGRVFTWLVVVGPAFWLFPPSFVRSVVLPMLAAIGAR